jgi:hypothetical protein
VSSIDLASLIVTETQSRIFDRLVTIASALGLSTESWQPGDPTRSILYAEADVLATLEAGNAAAIRGGFLRLAEGAWKTLCAYHVFNVERTDEQRATCLVTLTNSTTTNYGTIAIGDLIVRNSTTGATYRNATSGSLAGLGSIVGMSVEAEDAGSAGTSGVGDIDELVTGLPGVTVTNTTAAVGVDEETDGALETRCLAKLGSLSPAGPRSAYEYVATTPALNGGALVDRVRVVDSDPADGTCIVYLAGPAGAVAGGDVALVQAGLDTYAVPIGFEATATSAAGVTVNLSPTIYVYDSIGRDASDVADELEDLLTTTIGARPIGGDDGGYIYGAFLEATLINAVAPHGFRVSSISDVALTSSQVGVPGTITVTVTIVGAP